MLWLLICGGGGVVIVDTFSSEVMMMPVGVVICLWLANRLPEKASIVLTS